MSKYNIRDRVIINSGIYPEMRGVINRMSFNSSLKDLYFVIFEEHPLIDDARYLEQELKLDVSYYRNRKLETLGI